MNDLIQALIRQIADEERLEQIRVLRQRAEWLRRNGCHPLREYRQIQRLLEKFQ